MLGYKRNANSINTIFNERNFEKDLLENRRTIKSSNEGADFNIPNKGSVYDFVKSKVDEGGYKKIYPKDTHLRNYDRRFPDEGVHYTSTVDMCASDYVQKVLLETNDSVLFVPSGNPNDSWFGKVEVYVKIPSNLVVEFENNVLSKHEKGISLLKEGIVKCDEGFYYRLTFLPNESIEKEDLSFYALNTRRSSAVDIISSFERFKRWCTYIFDCDEEDVDVPFEKWMENLWNYAKQQDYKNQIFKQFETAYDTFNQYYENERTAKEEAARTKQAEKEATIQSYIDWIEEGNPVYKIFGWAWKGARYNPIEPDEAISEIRNDRPFEIQYKTINGEQALVLQYVGENDMY